MAGAGYYPPADEKTQWFQTKHPGSFMKPEKVVWHTTEGTDWPTYSGGSIAPNFTVKANFTTKKMDWRQHFPINRSSRALRNAPGGVQTNMDGAVQVEIIGTCDPVAHAKWKSPHLFSPVLTDWQIEGFAQFVVWMNKEHGVPLATPSVWLNYGVDTRAPGRMPASYGASPARLTGRNWDGFRGHCGHQHVPENVHGDPGAFPMAKIIIEARELMAPAPIEVEREMQPTDKIKLTAAAARAMSLAGTPHKEGDLVSLSYLWQWGGAGAYRELDEVRQVEAKVDVLDKKLDDVIRLLTPPTPPTAA